MTGGYDPGQWCALIALCLLFLAWGCFRWWRGRG
jgi:hypothetical protein